MTEGGLTERLLRQDRGVVIAAIIAIFTLAGVYTIFGAGMRMSSLEMTAMRGMSDMPGPNAPGDWSFGYAILVLLMWWVMMVAMMLPSVSPTVLLYSALLRRGSDAALVPAISAAFLGGYLTVWGGFSAFATTAQWALEATGFVSATMMKFVSTVPGGLFLILAGIFQFTPLKQVCLTHCRSPAKFITEKRRTGVDGAFRMGLEHGVYCLGCCWFLMLLLFVGGIMDLYWIVGLGALVAFEKLTRYGETISKITGATLVVWGGLATLSAI